MLPLWLCISGSLDEEGSPMFNCWRCSCIPPLPLSFMFPICIMLPGVAEDSTGDCFDESEPSFSEDPRTICSIWFRSVTILEGGFRYPTMTHCPLVVDLLRATANILDGSTLFRTASTAQHPMLHMCCLYASRSWTISSGMWCHSRTLLLILIWFGPIPPGNGASDSFSRYCSAFLLNDGGR